MSGAAPAFSARDEMAKRGVTARGARPERR
jgi:hypothetical protein